MITETSIKERACMGPEKILYEVKTHLKAVISRKSPLGETLWNEFINLHPVDIAHFLSELDPEQFKELFLVLPQELVCEVFSELSQTYQVLALSSLTNANRVDVLSCLTADEMTDIFENLSDSDLKKYLNLLHKRDRDKVLSLLKFDPQSAGGIMDTEVLALQDTYTVKKSIELI
jgi:magnesium transporter